MRQDDDDYDEEKEEGNNQWGYRSVIMTGGRTEERVAVDAWILDTSGWQWRRIKDMAHPRCAHSSVALSGPTLSGPTLVIFGGISDGMSLPEGILCLTAADLPDESEETECTAGASVRELRAMIQDAGLEHFDCREKVELVNRAKHALRLKREKAAHKWRTASVMSSPAPRFGHSGIRVDAGMLVFGGIDFENEFADVNLICPG
eukprot:CAMPEP_0185748800 /NCGR_PEP_ID=MMETSP1174-20130828/7508_1 /TAXON_ID=35687 /ORGANISM="Dictyocha speculum, Strain CCMP1381" /LENGTH=203 /DNA_ID=CAMNT_0028424641 /DNA_START=72 /DNA_END=683 /DNA_ORIENTATION=-